MVFKRKRHAAPAEASAWQIERGNFPLTLPGLLQLAQAIITQAWEEEEATPYIVMAEGDDAPPVGITEESRPPDAELVQTQAKLAGEGYSRTAAIEAVPDGVRITARDNAGNKLTSVAHVERGLLTPWSTPAAETEHGVGLLGLPVFDSAPLRH